ncbi:FHA domain-containing protein [Desulfobacter curvatus]|uniref:FHA domain-containing protein n=1 Tax=Desulfobacter curvatus TaxID=2290 RepID=UPI0003656713|nr:FHA domain-containing protein [Desulfobacter curvatus]
MNSSNFFDDDGTVYGGVKSDFEEEKLLFFMEDDPENKLCLSSGTEVTVGRQMDNNFFIENRTVSRKHLKIIRNGGKVKIEIYGRNGLYMDSHLYAGPTIDITPPASFSIGDVLCRLEFEYDEEKTVIITPRHRPEQASRAVPEPPPSFTEAVLEPKPVKPFDPSPKDTFMSPDSGSLDDRPPFSADSRFSDNWKQEYTGPSPQPSSTGPEGDGGFDPIQRTAPDLSNQTHGDFQQPASPPPPNFDPAPQAAPGIFEPVPSNPAGQARKISVDKDKLIIAGIICLAVLIIISMVYMLFFSGPGQKETVPGAQVQSPPAAVETPKFDRFENNEADAYKTHFNKAERLINQGDVDIARDYLKDIPEGSHYYGRAQRLLDKYPEN